MSSENAIMVEGLSKCYRTYPSPNERLKEILYSGSARLAPSARLKENMRLQANQMGRQFWAVKDLSFAVKRGQTMGILGRNGAGKSTLLQLITGTLTPTEGSISTQGTIAALLELGSGFNPAFTGLQNVYLNASLLGLSKEQTDEKLEKILEFAEIGHFIHEPVRTYSSGMVVRLAFAIQAQLEPEILIVDEALSVGDARFQVKCFARLKSLVENGTTVLFVSHSTEQIVTHCDSAILLNQGQIIEAGEPRQVVNRYMDELFGKKAVPANVPVDENAEIQEELPAQSPLTLLQGQFAERPYYNPTEYRWGNQVAEFQDFVVSANGVEFPPLLEPNDQIQFMFKVYFHSMVVRPIFGFTLKTKEGVTIYGTNSEMQNTDGLDIANPGDTIFIKLDMPMRLANGDYFVSVGIASRTLDQDITPHDRRYDSIHLRVEKIQPFFGLVDLQAQITKIM